VARRGFLDRFLALMIKINVLYRKLSEPVEPKARVFRIGPSVRTGPTRPGSEIQLL
jgi:hypothetical protein